MLVIGDFSLDYGVSAPSDPSTNRQVQTFPTKPCLFIISDISNEPDDVVRSVLSANQFSIMRATLDSHDASCFCLLPRRY